MIEAALVGAGGVNYLIRCAHKQPIAFLSLVGRVLPLQLAGTDRAGNSVPISFEWAKATPPPLIEGSAVRPAAVEVEPMTIEAEPLETE